MGNIKFIQRPPRMAIGKKGPLDQQGEPVKQGKISFWRMIFDQGIVTQEIILHSYAGSGTEEEPYVVTWIPNDPRNPILFSLKMKCSITILITSSFLAVAFVSSAYTGAIAGIEEEFKISNEVATLGLSLFVLGFAIGPLLWAPLSELYGRQVVFISSYCALTAFTAGCAGSQSPGTLMILRFLAGAFGSAPLTNAGGVIADIFSPEQRGIVLSIFSATLFLGPVIGPIVGGFLGIRAGWRWVLGFLGLLCGLLWILGSLFIPETYSPVLLRRRAERLSEITGQVYRSKLDGAQGKNTTPREAFRLALFRPWVLLFKEPIVLIFAIYLAIVYGTLYMLFAAYPIVFQESRHWNQGVSGLAFLGIMIGILIAVVYSVFDNRRYVRIQTEHAGFPPPEARLPPCLVGSIFMPIGLFWFAWTNSPSIHWIVPIASGVPFGFGMVLVFVAVLNYLVDAYTIFAASTFAANSILRSSFGAAFPLFANYMYDALGIHWASSVPAFLALACAPFPFLFYKYGKAIRKRCEFADQANILMQKLWDQSIQNPINEGVKSDDLVGETKVCDAPEVEPNASEAKI